jgi:hypothetical protein
MVCSIKEPKKLPTKAITDMIPSAIAVDKISDFRCLLICFGVWLDVVLDTEIVKVSVLICLNVPQIEGLVSDFVVL